jgi:hypothetical protein
MTIIARFTLGTEPTENISGYVLNNGHKALVNLVDLVDGWATVEAYEGEPFEAAQYGYTDLVTIPVTRFQPAFQKLTDKPAEPKRQSMTLLDLAMAAEKEQWHSGESVWIWGNKQQGAFLKQDRACEVVLYLVGVQRGCLIFTNTITAGWQPVPDLARRYANWMSKVKGQVQR